MYLNVFPLILTSTLTFTLILILTQTLNLTLNLKQGREKSIVIDMVILYFL